MKPTPDDDLLTLFARQRQSDHEHVPAWRPELLNRPMQRQSSTLRWIPAALATACAITLAVFIAEFPKSEKRLSETLPPLFDSSPGELFASLEPSFASFDAPSDFLLPQHINLHIP